MKRFGENHARVIGERPRMSREVLTPLLIAAGLIGAPLAIGLSHYATDDAAPATAPTPPPQVNENTAYEHNSLLPGAGYYHAPYHAWFPFAYNFYDASRGYFRGGTWRRTAEEERGEPGYVAPPANPGVAHASGGYVGAILPRFYGSSLPSVPAVLGANAAAAAHHTSTIQRGGFGSSSRSGIS